MGAMSANTEYPSFHIGVVKHLSQDSRASKMRIGDRSTREDHPADAEEGLLRNSSSRQQQPPPSTPDRKTLTRIDLSKGPSPRGGSPRSGVLTSSGEGGGSVSSSSGGGGSTSPKLPLKH
jgi:hypothetical protein